MLITRWLVIMQDMICLKPIAIRLKNRVVKA